MDIEALICIAEGTEETEAVTVFDLLKRANLKVKLVSLAENPSLLVNCSRGLQLKADCTLDQVINQSAKAIILPGGLRGAENFRDCPKLIEKIRQLHAEGTIIAAICASPALVLQYHQLFPEAKMTGYPSTQSHFKNENWVDTRVYYDENYRVLTSQGPATSIDFALKLVELLAGSESAAIVASQLVLPLGIYDYQRCD